MRNKIFNMVAAIGLSPGADKLPEWYCIFPEGVSEVEGLGKYLVDRVGWDHVAARIARRGVDIVFDYEHQTLADTQAPAAGWCKKWRYRDGVGIEAQVEWTSAATAYIVALEYRYFSPVFQVRGSDKRIFAVHSVALTNAPRTNNIKPLLAKLGGQLDREETMELLQRLSEALQMADGSGETEVMAEIAALQKKAGAGAVEGVPAAVVAALGIAESDETTVVASIHALKQGRKNMVSREEFVLLTAKLADLAAGESVAQAMEAGKITPDQRDWATKYAASDPEGFGIFVSKAPVIIPVGALPPGESSPGDGGDANVMAVAKMLDVSEDDLKKFGGLA